MIINYVFWVDTIKVETFRGIVKKKKIVYWWVEEFFNWYVLDYESQKDLYWRKKKKKRHITFLLISTQLSDLLILTSEWRLEDYRCSKKKYHVCLETFGIYSFCYFFFIYYVVIMIYKLLVDFIFLTGYKCIIWNQFIIMSMYMWVYNGVWKVDSAEEIICLTIIWPWCVFLIFTHLVSSTDYIFMFGFSEWGLPVFYGLLLLFEHLWLFGVHLIVYLMGSRGRRNLFVTYIEDMIAIIIMIARVLLQSIRGIIVGMFHFICRETLLNMARWREWEFIFNSRSNKDKVNISLWNDINEFIIDIVVASGGLLFIIAIMFLQLTFLIISVWLFCKCWFISFRDLNIGVHKKQVWDGYLYDRIRDEDTD